MKLTFRGHSYEFPAPIQLDSASTVKSNIRLIYRGHTYHSTPRPAVFSEAVEPDKQTVTLGIVA
jgi:hypothetical protein